MLRHLLTLTWKRKSRNLMVSLEILLAFAIVFAIAAVARSKPFARPTLASVVAGMKLLLLPTLHILGQRP